MPPKATPLKVPTNGISSTPSPLTPRTTASSNFIKPSEAASSNNEQSGEIAVGNMSSPLELTNFVDTLLQQLESKFTDMSQQVLEKMDQMSNRIDSLEMSLQDLLSSDLNTPDRESPSLSRPASSASTRIQLKK